LLHAGDRSAEALSEHAAHPLIAGLAVKPLVPILRNVDRMPAGTALQGTTASSPTRTA
jgi:hypothetical protein